MKTGFSTIVSSSLLAAGVAFASSLTAAPAQAIQFGFNNISGNDATNAFVGTQQLKIDVTDVNGQDTLSATQALFKFSNIGSEASSITQIYFDNGTTLKNVSSITGSGAGVSFSTANKGNLPAGNNVKFTEYFTVDANSPVQPSGVNPGEFVSILFNLNTGKTLKDVVSELTSGNLRLGIHVQGFANGGSESFVNNPVATTGGGGAKSVPEPATLAGLGLVAGAMAVSRRHKVSKTA